MTDDQGTYSLPTETLPTLNLSHHLTDINEIRDFLESRGIPTRHTRIERYSQYLEGVAGHARDGADGARIFKNSAGPPFLSQLDWFLYVLREVHELMWILRGLKTHVPQGVDERMRTIVGGREFAALDVRSRSRDAQFELRIASYFCQAGCAVDMSTETDIIALTDREVFYLECKRVAVAGQLGKRMSEARKQLRRRMPRKHGPRLVLGCIAVDVTKVAFSHNGLTLGLTNEHSRDVIQKRLIDIAAHPGNLFSFDSCRQLLGYWLQVHISSIIAKPVPTPATRFSSYHLTRSDLTKTESKGAGVFYGIFESGSRKDTRSNASRALTPRSSVEFPAGSQFSLNADRLLQLLTQTDVSEDEESEVVASWLINSVRHEFTFFDVRMLPSDAVAEWVRAVRSGAAQADVTLLAELYLQRHPYQEDADIA